jgi:pimeloyl-ACP methyl ester carboxylesterase
MDNVSVAKDIDAIRAALGEEQLSLYDVSYGTLTGQMYAERFPSRVRALVLDSVFDHSLSAARFLNTEAAAGEDAFGEFASWCARTSSCAVSGRDARQAYSDLYERAAAGADAPFAVGAFCGDHRVRVSSEREWLSLWRMQKRFAPTMRSHFAWPLVSICAAWPAKVANPQHRPEIDVPFARAELPPRPGDGLLVGAPRDPPAPARGAAHLRRLGPRRGRPQRVHAVGYDALPRRPRAPAPWYALRGRPAVDDHARERTGEVLVVTQAAQLPVPTARDQVGAFRTSSLTSPAVSAKPVSDSSTAAPKITPIT